MKSVTADKFMLRLPDGLRDRIKATAVANYRSMNAEINFHLERVFGRSDAVTGEGLGNQAPATAQTAKALTTTIE
jgi:hypothetical protein